MCPAKGLQEIVHTLFDCSGAGTQETWQEKVYRSVHWVVGGACNVRFSTLYKKKKQLWVNSHESCIQWTSTTFWFSTGKSMKTRGAGVSSPTGDHFYNPCQSSCKQLWYLLISFISGYDIPDTAVVSHLFSGLSHTFYLNWQKDTKANVEPHNLQTSRFILQVTETRLSNQHFLLTLLLGFCSDL